MKVIDLKQVKEDCVNEIAEILFKEVDTSILDEVVDNIIDTFEDDIYIGGIRYRYSEVLYKLNDDAYNEEYLRALIDIAEDVYYEITDSVKSYKKFGIEFVGKN